MIELESEIVRLQTDLDTALREVGKYVYLNAEASSQAPYAKEFYALREALDEQQRLENHLSECEESRRRGQKIQQEIANARTRIKSIEDELVPLYEDVGRSAFEVFKDNPFIDPPYSELFGDLRKEEQALEGIAAELAEEERAVENKSFLGRLLARGKVTWLKTRKQSREHSFNRMFRKVGTRIVATDFVDVVEDPGLTAAMRTFHRQSQRIETLRDQIRRLEADLEHHNQEFVDGDTPSETLLQEKRRTDAQVSESQARLGRRYLKATKKQDLPEELKEPSEVVRNLEREVTKAKKRAHRLRQEHELTRLENEEVEIQRQLAGIHERKAELESNLAATRSQTEALRSQMAGAAKRASPARKRSTSRGAE